MNKPGNFKELFEFYYSECKPLHARLSADNSLPVELLTELHATLDHVSRHWHYEEDERSVVGQATGHLKRSTFDAFKLILKETRDHYDELQQIEGISLIDNGEFMREMHAAWTEIRELATQARIKEGDTRDPERWGDAFDLWKRVHILCNRFNERFFSSSHIPWAKATDRGARIRDVGIGFVVGVISGLVANYIFNVYNL